MLSSCRRLFGVVRGGSCIKKSKLFNTFVVPFCLCLVSLVFFNLLLLFFVLFFSFLFLRLLSVICGECAVVWK